MNQGEKKDCTYEIIGCCYEVFNTLGYGYLEKDYQKALQRELTVKGLKCATEYKAWVEYKDQIISGRRIDILVNDQVVVELKVGAIFFKSHINQLVNYLKILKKKIGLLVYFNPSGVYVKRVVNDLTD